MSNSAEEHPENTNGGVRRFKKRKHKHTTYCASDDSAKLMNDVINVVNSNGLPGVENDYSSDEKEALDCNEESDDTDKDVEQEIEYDYEVLSMKELVKNMTEIVEEVGAITAVEFTVIRVLLNSFKWDKEQLLEAYYANDDVKFVESHLSEILGFTKNENSVNSFENANECPICFSSAQTVKMITLKCKHAFCSICLSDYVISKVNEYSSSFISCPAYCCETLVDDHKVLSLLSTDEIKDRYHLLMTNSFVECNRLMRWCPKADCNRAIKVPINYSRPVKCECETVFCFRCGELWHETVPCSLYKLWLAKCDDKDAKETMNYLCSHTKNCPNCNVAIEKNGGCNYMKCSKCHYDFCWSCMSNMKHHEVGTHRCNSYENPENQNRIAHCRAELQRFVFYGNRYTNHHQSFLKEQHLDNTVKGMIATLQSDHNMSWIETQYLTKSLKVLWRCRTTLMFTYIFAYFLKKSNQQEIFEENQNDLENAVEKLSGVLESGDSIEDKCKIMDMQRYCESRRQILVKYVNEGYDKDWWEFVGKSRIDSASI